MSARRDSALCWTASACWRRSWRCATTPAPLAGLAPDGRLLAHPGAGPDRGALLSSWSAGTFSGPRTAGGARADFFEADADPLRSPQLLLYLPLNWYNGGFSPLEWLKKLLIDGTLYHLWYFPAVLLGVVIARGPGPAGAAAPPWRAAAATLPDRPGRGQLLRPDRASCPAAGRPLWRACSGLCSYTRNGLFLAPLFLLLGAAGSPAGAGGISALGTLAGSLAGMSARGVLAPQPRAGPATTACIFSSP